MSRRPPNPTGKGGFQKGKSGNPGGRPRKAIGDLSAEARRYAKMALDTLVEILQQGEERNRLVAAKELLDRGYGRPIQAVDMVLIGKKLTELTTDELIALNARFIAAEEAVGRQAEAEPLH